MLNVNYKDVIGHYTLTQDEKKFKITLCGCNALWAEMYFYTDDNGKKMVQLYSFIDEIQHLKNCIKNTEIYKDADNFVFNAKNMNDRTWKAVRLIANLGKKVTIK